MRLTLRIAIASVVILLVAPMLPAQVGNCNCSGFAKQRVGTEWSFVDGEVFARARDLLVDPAYFGPGGLAARPVVITGALTATEASLSGVNVFVTGWTQASTYTSDERTALQGPCPWESPPLSRRASGARAHHGIRRLNLCHHTRL